MGKTLAFIHTVASLAGPFSALAGELLPEVMTFHAADEGLRASLLRAGAVTPSLCLRVAQLAAQAQEDGADGILLTCSAMSPAVDLAAPLLRVPIFKVDQAMVESAVHMGGPVGILATVPVTLTSVTQLVRQVAAQQGRDVQVVPGLCSLTGQAETDLCALQSALRDLAASCGVIVISQASVATSLATVDLASLGVPVLTSPRLALERLRSVWL
jgi:hypothetical protein